MDYMQEQVDKYNATNTDNIEVEMKVMADNYNQAVEVAFASNQAPDIFKNYDFQTYVSKGYFAPLDQLLSKDFLAKFDGLLIEDIYAKRAMCICFQIQGSSGACCTMWIYWRRQGIQNRQRRLMKWLK